MITTRCRRSHLGSCSTVGKVSFSRWLVPFVVVLTAGLLTLTAADDDEGPTVQLDPQRLFVEVGTKSSEITCGYKLKDEPVLTYAYVWLDSNANPLNVSDSLRIFFNSTTGTLTLNEAEVNDTGDYTCVAIVANSTTCSMADFTECPNATLTYKVYIMPDYTTDGIIIGVINGVLLVIFVLCLIRSSLADRRRLRKYGQKT